MLLSYEEAAASEGADRKTIFNLAQRPEHAGIRKSLRLPTLLQQSILWCPAARRMLLPQEHMVAMGHSLYTNPR
eukprot:5545991-Alexandrium_andersonii.AAC.1